MDEGVPRPAPRESRRRPAHPPSAHHRYRQRELALPPRTRAPRTQKGMTPRPGAAPAAIATQALALRARPSRRQPRHGLPPGDQATSTTQTTDARWGHIKPSRRGQCKPSFPETGALTSMTPAAWPGTLTKPRADEPPFVLEAGAGYPRLSGRKATVGAESRTSSGLMPSVDAIRAVARR
jgi:hypothetical protein